MLCTRLLVHPTSLPLTVGCSKQQPHYATYGLQGLSQHNRLRKKRRSTKMKKVKKAIRFVPFLYKNAPRLVAQAFPRYIVKFETEERKNPITLPQGRQFFVALREMSRKATNDGRHQDVIIDLDYSLSEWGGVDTPYHR